MSRLSIRVVHSAADLAVEIDSIANLSKVPFFYRRAFLEAYQDNPIQPVGKCFYLEVLDESGRLVAFAPCYLQGDILGAFGPPTMELSLLSHCWHCYDTRLPTDQLTPDLVRLLLETMREEAERYGVSRYGFINVERASAEAEAMKCAGLPAAPLDTRYVLDLSGFSTEDDYLASLRLHPRQEYRRHLRRAVEVGVVSSIRRTSTRETAEGMRLLETSAARAGSPGYYRADRIADFLSMVGNRARVIEVALEDDLIALGIIFLDDDRIHTWAAGYDRERQLPFSPYYVLYAAAVKLGFEQGLSLLEGGRRNDQFKKRFGMTPRSLLAFTITRDP